MRGITPRPWRLVSAGSKLVFIHLIIFSVLMPWTGKALSSKFDFRDDLSKVGNSIFRIQFISNFPLFVFIRLKESVESSLTIIHDISTENIGTLCITKLYSPLKIPLRTERYDGARQKSDLASVVLQELGFNNHWGELLQQMKSKLSHLIIVLVLSLA